MNTDLQVLFDLRPNEDYANDHIVRDPAHTATQAQRQMSEHEVNTTIIEYSKNGMVHQEVRDCPQWNSVTKSFMYWQRGSEMLKDFNLPYDKSLLSYTEHAILVLMDTARI